MTPTTQDPVDWRQAHSRTSVPNQLSSQWLIQATNGHELREGTMLKSKNTEDLLEPVKMALGTKDNQSKVTGKVPLPCPEFKEHCVPHNGNHCLVHC
jgi:hypothetical protein